MVVISLHISCLSFFEIVIWNAFGSRPNFFLNNWACAQQTVRYSTSFECPSDRICSDSNEISTFASTSKFNLCASCLLMTVICGILFRFEYQQWPSVETNITKWLDFSIGTITWSLHKLDKISVGIVSYSQWFHISSRSQSRYVSFEPFPQKRESSSKRS